MSKRSWFLVVLALGGGILLQMLSVVIGTERAWSTPLQNTTLFDFTLDQGRWSQRGPVLYNRDLWRINRFGDASHLHDGARPPTGEV